MDNVILEVKHLTVILKNNKRLLLNNVNFNLYENEVLNIEGFNGSGKSTLLKVILGYVSDYDCSGEIYYYPYSNKNLLQLSDKEILEFRSLIGEVKQDEFFDGANRANISDLIDFSCKDAKMTKEEITQVKNKLFYKYFPVGNKNKITLKSIPRNLSGGEKKMIAIFLGVVCRKNPKLIVIDEPLNNLDFINIMKISDMLNDVKKNMNCSILLVTHCKIITCITRQRRIVDGIMEEKDSVYENHHCMGNPDNEGYYRNIYK